MIYVHMTSEVTVPTYLLGYKILLLTAIQLIIFSSAAAFI